MRENNHIWNSLHIYIIECLLLDVVIISREMILHRGVFCNMMKSIEK